MHKWLRRAIPRFPIWCHAELMFRRRLQVLDSYEVIGLPVVGATRLSYVPWIERAVQPYRATRLPLGSRTGLADALRRASEAAAAA